VIAATRTGTEKNATVFARYWAEALRDPAADVDKTETISALEAFRFAQRKTADFYESQKRLATEHAVLEDTGKGEGERAPSAENGEGKLAAAFPWCGWAPMPPPRATPPSGRSSKRRSRSNRPSTS